MIVYDKLWDTMKRKGITQYKSIHKYGFSNGQLDRLRKNENINMYTLNTLCRILNCKVQDVIEYRPDQILRLFGKIKSCGFSEKLIDKNRD